MVNQLSRIGLVATRQRGIYPFEYQGKANVEVMRRRTPGAIGCHFSQVQVMRNALAEDKHALVMEDDLVFCEDFHDRMKYIEEWMETNEWDVFWLGASFHVNPPFWHKHGGSGMPPNCSANLGYDAKTTDDPRIMRTYAAFATFAYIVNVGSIQKILDLFDEHIHTSIGIDWLMIKLQPQLKCFSFVPGCVKQIDGKSDIGTGNTIWSGFLKLGPYVYQERMSDFDPKTFYWNEAL